MKIGVDLDNTILDYHGPIVESARHFHGIDLGQLQSRNVMKQTIQRNLGDAAWTRLQGSVYGEFSRFAKLYCGADLFLKRVRTEGHEVSIISHKTKVPISGPARDLRFAALENLSRLGLGYFEPEPSPRATVLFCETKAEKIRLIVESLVDVFIDDLFDVLVLLPEGIRRLHIFCDGTHEEVSSIECFADWAQVDSSIGGATWIA